MPCSIIPQIPYILDRWFSDMSFCISSIWPFSSCCLKLINWCQARSIQELAKKNFENLRQDSDDNEPEPRIVRRGRPPNKNLKKPPVKPSSELAGSEFSSDATLAIGGENAMWSNYDTRKGPHNLQKSAFADLSGQSHVARNNDFYSSWSAENKSEKIDDFTGS